MKINRATPDKHEYIKTLCTLSKPPNYIYYTGKLPSERLPSVAIVGTRKPSTYGREVAHMLSEGLAARGVVVISGLALGIDAIAHKAALDAGGTTIAVLANSVETIYPRSHAQLGERIIAEGGAILSEYEPPTEPRKYHFLARNRIVSGLADAIIIVEAASRSGTLSTATHALEQGKEVFVVPGNITSPLSSGCNALLKQGAHPVTCIEDVLEVIAPELLSAQKTLALGNSPLEQKIIALLQDGIRDGDILQRELAVATSELNHALTMMELSDTVRSLGGNRWTLR